MINQRDTLDLVSRLPRNFALPGSLPTDWIQGLSRWRMSVRNKDVITNAGLPTCA